MVEEAEELHSRSHETERSANTRRVSEEERQSKNLSFSPTTHCPVASQTKPSEHIPHTPLQPSLPHIRLPHDRLFADHIAHPEVAENAPAVGECRSISATSPQPHAVWEGSHRRSARRTNGAFAETVTHSLRVSSNAAHNKSVAQFKTRRDAKLLRSHTNTN